VLTKLHVLGVLIERNSHVEKVRISDADFHNNPRLILAAELSCFLSRFLSINFPALVEPCLDRAIIYEHYYNLASIEYKFSMNF